MNCLKSANLIRNFAICNERKNENNTLHAPLIPQSSIDKLFNSIFKVKSTNNGSIVFGTGFFIKLNIKNEEMNFIMTCNHVVSEENINESIEICQGRKGDEPILTIKLDINKRFIKFFEKPVDIALVQILESDHIGEDKFLYPDLGYKNGYDKYKYKNYYLAGYPKNDNEDINKENERCISSGTITNLTEDSENEFIHNLDTRSGSSGAPICLTNGLLVVGIHKEGHKSDPVNFGTFLGYILDKLDQEEIEEEIPIDGNIETRIGFNSNSNNDNNDAIPEEIETNIYEKNICAETMVSFKTGYKSLYKKWNKKSLNYKF